MQDDVDHSGYPHSQTERPTRPLPCWRVGLVAHVHLRVRTEYRNRIAHSGNDLRQVHRRERSTCVGLLTAAHPADPRPDTELTGSVAAAEQVWVHEP